MVPPPEEGADAGAARSGVLVEGPAAGSRRRGRPRRKRDPAERGVLGECAAVAATVGGGEGRDQQ